MSAPKNFRQWVKQSANPLAGLIRGLHRGYRIFEIPAPRAVFVPVTWAFYAGRKCIRWPLRTFLWAPMFKARLEKYGRRLFVYGGLPMITGPVQISVGDDCRISGQTTISGRWAGDHTPRVDVGSNVDIGWRSTLAVGTRIQIGDNVRIAERAFLAGYPGHPMNAEDRAAGLPDLDDQVGDIILEDDVWLASGVTVLPGVTIGRGTIVGAGSIVTNDLPAGVIAAGVPANVIREIDNQKLRVAA